MAEPPPLRRHGSRGGSGLGRWGVQNGMPLDCALPERCGLWRSSDSRRILCEIIRVNVVIVGALYLDCNPQLLVLWAIEFSARKD